MNNSVHWDLFFKLPFQGFLSINGPAFCFLYLQDKFIFMTAYQIYLKGCDLSLMLWKVMDALDFIAGLPST